LIRDADVQDDSTSLFFIIGIFALSFPIFHVATGRKGYVRVSESFIAAAEALEEEVNPKQLQKMMKLTRFSKGIFVFYIIEAIVDIVMCTLLWYSTPGLQLAFLPVNVAFIRRISFIEAVLITMGLISGVSIVAFHLEISICTTYMYNIVGELFQEASNQESVYKVIKIHQQLLHASKIFQQVFTTQWFSILIAALSVIIVSTYTVIALSFEINLIFLIVSLFVVLCRACVLGEMLTTSSSKIGFAIYQSNWLNTTPELRRDLCLAILRSQRPAYATAGFLGKLNLTKLSSIVQSWYKFVQALLNTRSK